MALIQSTKDGHYLTFNEEKHVYILDGRRVVGGSTFSKGGYPMSIGLLNWLIEQGSIATYRLVLRLLKNNPNKIFSVELLSKISKRAKYASEKTLRKTADIGTIMHDYAYLSEIKNELKLKELITRIELHKDKNLIEIAINKFLKWKKENIDEILGLEEIVAYLCPFHLNNLVVPEGSICTCFAGKFDRLYRRKNLVIVGDYKSASGFRLNHHIQQGAYALAIERWKGLEVGGLETVRFSREKGDPEALLISKPDEVSRFKRQALICRETYEFTKLENDKRWKFGGKK